MKMMKRLFALVMALVLCGAVALAEGSAEDVMLTVNGTAVTRAQYEMHLENITGAYSSYGFDMNDPELAAALKQYALQTGIEYALLDQKVIELGLALTEEEKTAATDAALADWENTIADGMVYYGLTDESTEEERNELLFKVVAELETMGYTEESYLAEMLTYAGYDKVNAYISRDVTVSDEEVVSYYNGLVEADKAAYENDAATYEQINQMNQMYAMYGMSNYVTPIYYKPAGYRLVTHILLGADEALLTAYADLQALYEEQQLTLEEGGTLTAEAVTEAQVEAARQAILTAVQPTVDEINQKLANGASFAELIPQYTTDPGMNNADAIAAGYEVHKDSVNWVLPFRDAAFTVDNIGDVTAPVVTDYGVHILQYVADVEGGAVPLTDEMQASFKASLLAGAQSDAYTQMMTQWMGESEIVYADEAKAILGITEEAAAE